MTSLRLLLTDPILGSALNALIGLIFGWITSWLFWKYMLYFKPRVVISAKIAKAPGKLNPDKGWHYLKVVNRTNRQVIGLQAKAEIYKTLNEGNTLRMVMVGNPIQLGLGSWEVLGGKDSLDDTKGISPIMILAIPESENLDRLLASDDRLDLTLTATDAISQTTSVYFKSYTRHDIVPGEFKRDLSLTISPLSG